MKIDIVTWTKNGEDFLPQVLGQVEKVIPAESVHRKIVVDDCSEDDTIRIAKEFNWETFQNPGSGISAGANFALSKVDCERFVSIEQDLLLSKEWWQKVPPLLDETNVVIASGIRLPSKPEGLRKLQEYTSERYRHEYKHATSFLFGKTLDNTIYKTNFMKNVGFPKTKVNAGVDTILAKIVSDMGFQWKVDFDVRSEHIRKGLWHELEQYHWYGKCQRELQKALEEKGEGFSKILLRTLFSPVRGIEVAYKKRCWHIAYIYPLIRLSSFLGILESYVKSFK